MRKYFQGLGRTKWEIGKKKKSLLSNTDSESILSSVKHIPRASMDRQTDRQWWYSPMHLLFKSTVLGLKCIQDHHQ